MICDKCKNEVSENKRFCGHCGYDITSVRHNEEKLCETCGTKLVDGQKFCSKCGNGLQLNNSSPINSEGNNINKANYKTNSNNTYSKVVPILIGFCFIALLFGGGYYAYSSGLIEIPFKDKLSFLHSENTDKIKSLDENLTEEIKEETESIKPIESIETTESTESTESKESIKSTESIKPTETIKPTESIKPIETTESIETTKTTENINLDKQVPTVPSPKEEYLNSLQYSYRLEEDIQKAQTQSDLNISSGIAFTAWDEELNKIYGLLKEKLSAEKMEILRNEERAWIKMKDKKVEEAGADWEGGSGQALVENMEAINLTKERTLELIEMYFLE